MPPTEPPETTRTDPTPAGSPFATDAQRSDASKPPPSSASRRYQNHGEFVKGGMGEVEMVHDQQLMRWVARKSPQRLDPTSLKLFEREARITGFLQHPGVVPIYDYGVDAQGTPWFTMRKVGARTFDDVLRALRGERADPLEETWTLRRTLQVLVSATLTLAYAHDQQVSHRDVKPSNLMVGEHGDIVVIDWGIAKAPPSWDSPLPEIAAEPPPDHDPDPAAGFGSARYAAPEQVQADAAAQGPATDVYALGAILHEILYGRPLFEDRDAMRRRFEGLPLEWPEEPAAHLRPLLAVAKACLAPRPSDRPSATQLARAIQSWLDGEERRLEARQLVAEALPHDRHAKAMRRKARELQEQANELLEGVAPHAPEEDRWEAWALQEEAERHLHEAVVAQTRYEQDLRGALTRDPDLPEAHEALAALHLERLLAAERVHDRAAVAYHERMLRQHDRGTYAGPLRNEGLVTLDTRPTGAEVWYQTYQSQRGRLRLGPRNRLGTTPLAQVPLPAGSHLLSLEAPGHLAVRYPVRIERGEHLQLQPPDSDAPRALRLPTAAASDPERECYIAEGWFVAGGDPEALDAIPRRRLWLDAYFIDRHPVTRAEYAHFLNDLLHQGREAEALEHCPRHVMGVAVPIPAFNRAADGRFLPTGEDLSGNPWLADEPVVLVSWHDACAFAAWRSAKTRQPWRLPWEWEWEKAARGVDGRFFPWGNELISAWCCMQASHQGKPRLASVHDYEVDTSPFGLRGAAGNVREWCANGYRRVPPRQGSRALPSEEPQGALRVARGGAWTTAASLCRVASRVADAPERRVTSLGFRLARAADHRD